MAEISKEEVERAIKLIDGFCDQLDNSFLADRLLRGTLYELKMHFIQRGIVSSYCYDLDFIMVKYNNREASPSALVEIKTKSGVLSENQKRVYLIIAKSLEVPFYLLTYCNDNEFLVERLDVFEEEKRLSYQELEKWFQSLSMISKDFNNKTLNLSDIM